MKPLRTRSRKPAAPCPALRRGLEALEARTVPAVVAPPPGLVSWWTGDNTAADLRGLNNGTLNAAVTYAPGKVGQTFNFTPPSWVNIADSESLKFTGSMSVEGWVLASQFPGSLGAIFIRGDERNRDPYSFGVLPDGRLQFQINSLTATASVSAPLPTGRFVHVAATLDDGTGAMRLYVDGALAVETTTAVRPFRDLDPASSPGVGIGQHAYYPNATTNYSFHGMIDELSVYGRALTANEVYGIYWAGNDGKIKTSNYVAADFPTVTEGPSASNAIATFTIRRSGSLSGQVVVNWATADGTATAGSDYVAASGQLVFQSGESQKTVQVTVAGDDAPEGNESIRLVLSTTTPGYAVGAGLAFVANDDVGISVGDAAAVEGSDALAPVGALIAPGPTDCPGRTP